MCAPAGSDILRTNYPRPLGAPETSPGSPAYNPYAMARDLERLAPRPTDIVNPVNGNTVHVEDARMILPFPNGPSGGYITLVNDDQKKPSPDVPVSSKQANAIHQVVRETGHSININSTTGGVRLKNSNSGHYDGEGTDSNRVNDASVKDAYNYLYARSGPKDHAQEAAARKTLDQVLEIQEAAKKNPDVTEVLGPERSWLRINGQWEDRTSDISPSHRDHFHIGTTIKGKTRGKK